MVLTFVFTFDSNDVLSWHKHTIQSFSTDILFDSNPLFFFYFLANLQNIDLTNLAVLEAKNDKVHRNTIDAEIPIVIKGACLYIS